MFHLVRKTEGNVLEVVTKENYTGELGQILFTGDENAVNSLKEKLQKTSSVVITAVDTPGDNICINEQSPILKIIRTVTVTSSGNTIADPFRSPELSEDEYVPSTLEASDSSTDYEVNAASIAKVKRVIDFSDKKSTTSSSYVSQVYPIHPIQEQPSSSTSSRLELETSTGSMDKLAEGMFDVVVAVVTVSNSKVDVNVLRSVHAGTYEVPLFRALKYSGKTGLHGYIRKRTVTKDHKCKSLDSAEVACVTSRSSVHSIKCQFNVCCPKCSLLSEEQFIEDSKTNIAFLKRVLFQSQSDDESQDTVEDRTTEGRGKLKRHYCCFCKKLKTCLPKHYSRMHANEPEVKQILDLQGADRITALRKLRLRGDHIYNKTVKAEGRISVRRPVTQSIEDSVHCPECEGLFSRSNFAKHHMRCAKRLPDGRKRITYIEREDTTPHHTASTMDEKILETLLRDLHEDEIKDVIKEDPLIKSLGVYMSKSNRTVHHLKNSRMVMRRCARLLLIIRSMDDSVKYFEDCMVPSKYGLIMEATRILCEKQVPSAAGVGVWDKLKHPTVALHIGPTISNLISRLRRYYLEERGMTMASPKLQLLESFKNLHDSDFAIEITRDALYTTQKKRFETEKGLPLPSDIQKLMEYCDSSFQIIYKDLSTKEFDFFKWKKLGQIILCQLMVFNRRRGGEISRTTLDNYANKKKVDKEQHKSLNRYEIICAELFTMIHIRGKRGRTLSLLLKPDNIKGLDLYIALRKKAFIPDDNPYLFAYNNKDGYLWAPTALSLIANQCGAEKPQLLKGTLLRKHAATMCQLFNLNENELKQTADFMGHNIDVHFKHYRLPEQTTQIVTISRFLSVVGDKDVFEHRGKTWEQLERFVPHQEVEDRIDSLDEDEDILPNAQVVTEDPNMTSCSHDTPPQVSDAVPEMTIRRKRQAKQKKVWTPSKQKIMQSPKPLKSPTSVQLLNMLSDPANRKRTRIRSKRIWNERETSFMEETFQENLKPTGRQPKKSVLQDIVNENPDVFQEGRTADMLYAWIQYHRRKQ